MICRLMVMSHVAVPVIVTGSGVGDGDAAASDSVQGT